MNFFSILIGVFCFAGPERISKIQKDLTQVDRIYLAPGLVSVIELPQPVIEVRIGNPQAVKVQVSTVSPRELTIYLTQASIPPTNLIVRTDKRAFVFDVIPSRANHQDVIRITSGHTGFGKGELLESRALVPVARLRASKAIEEVSLGGQQ